MCIFCQQQTCAGWLCPQSSQQAPGFAFFVPGAAPKFETVSALQASLRAEGW